MKYQRELKDFIIKHEKQDIPSIDSLQLDQLVHLIYKMSNEDKK